MVVEVLVVPVVMVVVLVVPAVVVIAETFRLAFGDALNVACV